MYKPKGIYISYFLMYYRMKEESHIAKAERIEKSIEKLDKKQIGN